MIKVFENFKKTSKNQSGITLIAIVISIIVLLVLTVLVFNFSIGENGIVKKTINSKNIYNIESAKEKINMLATTYFGEFYTKNEVISDVTISNAADYISKAFLKENKIDNYKLEIHGRIILIKDIENFATGKIKNDGSIEWGNFWISTKDENGKLIVTNGIQVLNVGDYINYNHKEGAIKVSETSYAVDNGNNNKTFNINDYNYGWRILGTDENEGQILIIPEMPINSFTIRGKSGYKNGINELNKLCSLYGQGKNSTGSRSINENDIKKITNLKNNTHICKYYWTGLDTPIYKDGNIVARLYNSHNSFFYWFNEDNNEWESSTASETATSNKSEYITELIHNHYSLNINNLSTIDNNIKEMLIGKAKMENGTTTFVSNNGVIFNYWLASKYVYCGTADVQFGLHNISDGIITKHVWMYLYASDNVTRGSTYGIIPVVYLKNDIKYIYDLEKGKWNFYYSED